MNAEERIDRLKLFKSNLVEWRKSRDDKLREWLNHNVDAVERDVTEAGCFVRVTISPPPAIGGMIMRNVNPFDMMFENIYSMSLIPKICDMLDQTVGVLLNPPPEKDIDAPKLTSETQEGYAFVAMTINTEDHQLVDVLEAIKEAAKEFGIAAERIDEAESNDRITSRILASIRRAEYVIADLTNERPNVFYEAGYAEGVGKTPIYIARKGTKVHFDVKDYPIIEFRNMKELKDGLRRRISALIQAKTQR
jgi:hypothetical protein